MMPSLLGFSASVRAPVRIDGWSRASRSGALAHTAGAHLREREDSGPHLCCAAATIRLVRAAATRHPADCTEPQAFATCGAGAERLVVGGLDLLDERSM